MPDQNVGAAAVRSHDAWATPPRTLWVRVLPENRLAVVLERVLYLSPSGIFPELEFLTAAGLRLNSASLASNTSAEFLSNCIHTVSVTEPGASTAWSLGCRLAPPQNCPGTDVQPFSNQVTVAYLSVLSGPGFLLKGLSA